MNKRMPSFMYQIPIRCTNARTIGQLVVGNAVLGAHPLAKQNAAVRRVAEQRAQVGAICVDPRAQRRKLRVRLRSDVVRSERRSTNMHSKK